MASYECINSEHSLTLRLSILLYIIITLFSLVSTHAYKVLGGTTVAALQYLPMVIILKHVVENSIFSKKIKYRIYILWIIPFLFFYFLCFGVIATKSLYIKEIIGVKFNFSTLPMIKIVPVFFMSWYLLQIKDIKFNKLLTITVFGLLTANCLLTLKNLTDDPLITRTLAAGFADEETFLKGITGFEITYSVVLLVPCILFLISQLNKANRSFVIAFFILAIVYIYMCGYTIAILITLLVIFIHLYMSASGFKKLLLLFPIIVTLVMAIDRSVVVNIVNVLVDKIELRPVQMRLIALIDLIMHGDSSSDSLARFSLYKQSLDGFMESPILGIFVLDSNYELSGHSTMLDMLGGSGLFGFMPFCMFLCYSYKYSQRYIKNTQYKKCIISTYIAFVCIATLNPQMQSPNVLFTLLVIIPLICSITDTARQ
jgi:hypothetical protein